MAGFFFPGIGWGLTSCKPSISMLFTGEHECKLDAKGRLLLPARLKARLAEGTTLLWAMRGFEPCLVLYPPDQWEVVAKQVSDLSEFSEKSRLFQRSFLRGASELDLDAAGRLLLPKTMMTYAGLEGTVLAVGVANRIEIWNPVTYENHLVSDQSKLSAEAEQILGKDKSDYTLQLQRN